MSSLYAFDPRARETLLTPKSTPGYCIFIDIVDSVRLKDRGLWDSCSAMYNLLNSAKYFLNGLSAECDPPDEGGQLSGLPPLKIVGDCIMFYIPKRAMPDSTNALNIFDALLKIVWIDKGVGRTCPVKVRASVTDCEHAYEITFVRGTEDINGKDVDLAARLVKEAAPQELVMNEAFYLAAKAAFLNWKSAGNKNRPDDGFEQFANVQGPWTKMIRGFDEPLDLFKWRAPANATRQ